MKKYTIDTLEKAANRVKERESKKRKIRYKLAKSLGFTSEECIILQFKNEEIIKELAEERRLKQIHKGE